MQVEPRVIQTELQERNFRMLYLLHGEEIFMIDEILTLLKEKVSGPGGPMEGLSDFNLNTFYASDCEVETVLDTVQTLPMMSSRRLVILKQAESFSASELEKLTPIIESPVDTTIFVMVATKIDMRKKFFKLFDQNGAVLKFVRPFDNQLLPWIHHIAKKHGKTLSADAAEYVKQCVGAHLSDINNELAKAAQYLGDCKQVIEIDDLRNIISRTRVESVFEFVNCLGTGDAANSLTNLAHLLDSGENEIGVLTMIIRHYRILMLCHEGLREGLSPSQISSRVGVHGFFIKDYLTQARGMNAKTLKKIYSLLLDTDRALKSNPLSSHIWLENLVLQACNP